MPGMYQGAADHSTAPVAFIHVLPICPRHPGKGTRVPWEVHQAADLLLCSHGTLTPPRFSPSCPHCMIPANAGAVTGQKYHCILSHLMTAAGCRPGICSWFLPLPTDFQRLKSYVSLPPDHGEPLRRLFGKLFRTYLMKCIFDCQGSMHSNKCRTQSSSSCCSEVSLLGSSFAS